MSLISTFYFGSAKSIVAALESADMRLLQDVPQYDFSGGIGAPALMPEDIQNLLGVRHFDSLLAESFSPAQAEHGIYRLKPEACSRLANLDAETLKRFDESQKAPQAEAAKNGGRRGCLGSAAFWKIVVGLSFGIGINSIIQKDSRFLIAMAAFFIGFVGLGWYLDRRRLPRKPKRQSDLLPALQQLQQQLKSALDRGDDIIYHWSL